MIQGLNHFTVWAAEPARALEFYGGVLGLVEGPRPDLGFPGAWLYARDGGPALLHLVFGRARRPAEPGALDHVAFSAQGLAEVKARLDAHGVGYELRRQAGVGPWQIFLYDPDGARIELDFDPDERP